MGKVKWDAIADQTLLATIVETHHLSVDAAKVAEAWPTQDEDHRPTPRAIKERLHKIRELNRARNPDAAISGPSSPATPKKRTPRKKSDETSTTAGPSRKRKRTDDAADEEKASDTKEEGDVTAEHGEPFVESPAMEETALEHIDSGLHPKIKQESPDFDNEEGDADWTAENENSDTDSDQLLK
ncbi:uncharacterized protein N7500_004038 [Penicillium coprophilum]|uniref:uncharacterized protein n=1 Tax=Penicillium coprophilum TaxID=36646 RepID=UPI0023A61E96|nr:uncharacterized protein N7500_004038 [Penicillium coprophilum]KAJ5171255.1 hypothetical protein N7500_004038 [Penicillium coprophilum]